MNEQGLVTSAESAGCRVRLPQATDCDNMAELAIQPGYKCSGEEVRLRLVGMQDAKHYIVYVAESTEGTIAGWVGGYMFRSVETEPIPRPAQIRAQVVNEHEPNRDRETDSRRP